MNSYYRITWDPDFPQPWWLGEVECETTEIDCRIFTEGASQEVPGPLRIRVREAGNALLFTFSAFDVPVVTREVGDIFARYAPDAIQRIPIKVADIADKYEVLNVTLTCDALDLVRGKYLWWQPGDHRADLVGTLRSVYTMIFRPDLQPPPHLFRIKEWEIALVVSRELMEALRAENIRGIKFLPIEQ